MTEGKTLRCVFDRCFNPVMDTLKLAYMKTSLKMGAIARGRGGAQLGKG
jgi:hypothetical protein